MGRRCQLLLFCMLMCGFIHGQRVSSGPVLSFQPVDTFEPNRFWLATGITAALYTGSVIALNRAWYKQYPRSSFHFFDDHREWRGMDKAGHLYSTYFESEWAYKIARWTGMRDDQAIWAGVGLGMFFQTTVEVLDGFSSQWGFSIADAGFNVLGATTFLAQQKGWGEQRIRLKVSSTPVDYPDMGVLSSEGTASTTLNQRSRDLFGKSAPERFLKDYNAQTTWLSVNVHAFLKNPESKFPRWLNIAVGYGAENMYGGFENAWESDGSEFNLSSSAFPRYSQFYLSPDIDFSRIPSRSSFVRTLLGIVNVFKMPGPVMEYNTLDGLRFDLRW